MYICTANFLHIDDDQDYIRRWYHPPQSLSGYFVCLYRHLSILVHVSHHFNITSTTSHHRDHPMSPCAHFPIIIFTCLLFFYHIFPSSTDNIISVYHVYITSSATHSPFWPHYYRTTMFPLFHFYINDHLTLTCTLSISSTHSPYCHTSSVILFLRHHLYIIHTFFQCRILFLFHYIATYCHAKPHLFNQHRICT